MKIEIQYINPHSYPPSLIIAIYALGWQLTLSKAWFSQATQVQAKAQERLFH